MSPEALTVAEAAELIGVSRATAYRMAAEGELPVKRFRGCVRVSKPFLEAFLASPYERWSDFSSALDSLSLTC